MSSTRPNDTVRIERLERLVEDLSAITDDLAEFFGDEFEGSSTLLVVVIDTLQDALTKVGEMRGVGESARDA